MHELPDVSEGYRSPSDPLLARIEALEVENRVLREITSDMISRAQPRPVLTYFRLERIVHDDSLVRFYTGFGSYELILAFFEFLGPSVDHLNYWGSKQRSGEKRREMKLDPINQLFLCLLKLRLNIKERDLAPSACPGMKKIVSIDTNSLVSITATKVLLTPT